MSRLLRIAVPLGVAAVLMSVLVIGFGSPSSHAAPGGNGRAYGHSNANDGVPTLTLTPNPRADVGQWVTVTGEGFPKDTSVFVVVTGSPSLLDKTDRAGSFETGVAFAEPGTYTFSACYLEKNGRWDCNSTTSVILDVLE